jgi:hypothetical protein
VLFRAIFEKCQYKINKGQTNEAECRSSNKKNPINAGRLESRPN